MFKKLIEIRNNILLGTRLKLIVIAVSVLVIILCMVSFRSISKINRQITEINNGYINGLVKLSGLVENIYGILIESHIVDEKSLNENAVESSVNLDLIYTYLTEYEQSISSQEQKGQYDAFLLEFQNYLNILREVNSLTMKGNIQLAAEYKNEKEYPSYKKLQTNIKAMMAYNAEGIRKGNERIDRLKSKANRWIFFTGIVILALIILIAFYLFRDVNATLKLLASNLNILSKGQIPEKLLTDYKNEIGLMAGLTNGLTKNISELNRFANEISKGNYSTDYQMVGEEDLLGKALVNLRNNLILTKEEDEKRKLEDERRNWTNKGHAIFGEILRQRSRELSQLTDDIIKNLVYYLKANQGGLFIINDASDLPKIELISAFAYDRKKFFERIINIGDGLIGTVALERNTIYLKDVPEDYIEIESGLGEANPKFLLIVPLKFEDEILGIVELASFKEFLDFEIKFIEEVAQSIASTLLTAKINARTEQLLNESRKQSEVLALQEVGARQNIEEMRAAQELAKMREADLSGILSAVDNTLMKGEYELDGTLISVNNRHLQTMGYQLKEIKGKNIEMFIPKDELEHFRKVWANVVAGNPRQLEVRRRTKTGEILWLINQYTPVTDISGRINKILYLAHDITRYKKSEEESIAHATALEFKEDELKKNLQELDHVKAQLELKENELEGIFKAIDQGQLAIELDTQANILKVNNQVLQIFKIAFDEIAGKKYFEVFSSDKTSNQFENILDNLRSGVATSLISKYTLTDKSVIWLNEIYSPVLDKENRTVKFIIVANDITQQKELEHIKAGLLEESNKLSEELTKREKEIEDRLIKSIKQPEITDKKYLNQIKALETVNNALPRIETDLGLNIISVNKKFTEMLKYHERELINKHLSKIVVAKDKDVLSIKPEEYKETELIEIQINIMTKDRQVFPVSLHFIPIDFDKKGSEKIIIYLSGGEFNLPSDQKMIEINKELEIKKAELKEISDKVEKIKKEVETVEKTAKTESISDDLYTKWLNTLKARIDKNE